MNTEKNLRKRCGRSARLPKGCLPAKQSTCKHAWHVSLRIKGRPRFGVSLDQVRRARGDLRAATSHTAPPAYEPMRRQQLTRAEAEALYVVIRAEVRAGTYCLEGPVDPERPKTANGEHTFASAAAVVLEEKSGLASIEQERGYVERVGAVVLPEDPRPISAWPLKAFSLTTINRIFKAKALSLGASSKIRYKRAIKRVFTLAVREEWIARSPFAKDDPRKSVLVTGKQINRWERVEPELEEALMESARAIRYALPRVRMLALIVCALGCGARIGELLAMKWGDIKWEKNHIVITALEPRARKSGKGVTRLVPLTRLMVEFLAPLRFVGGKELGPTMYVFHNGAGERITGIDATWRWVVARAYGVVIVHIKGTKQYTEATLAALAAINDGKGLHFHDLRHEAALRWLKGGVPGRKGASLNTIAKALGHQNLKELEVYLGITEQNAMDDLAEAMGPDVIAPTAPRPALVYSKLSARVNPGDPIWLTVRIGRHGDTDFPGQFVHYRPRGRVRILLWHADGSHTFHTVDPHNVRPRVIAPSLAAPI